VEVEDELMFYKQLFILMANCVNCQHGSNIDCELLSKNKECDWELKKELLDEAYLLTVNLSTGNKQDIILN